MSEQTVLEGQSGDGYRTGRSAGLGIAALTLSLVSFVSLLGAEKAILAIVLGAMAARGAARGALARKLGVAAVCIGGSFLVTLAVLLVVYWGKVAELVQLLQKLS